MTSGVYTAPLALRYSERDKIVIVTETVHVVDSSAQTSYTVLLSETKYYYTVINLHAHRTRDLQRHPVISSSC